MKKTLGFNNICFLRDENGDTFGDVVLFNELVDLEDFYKRLTDFWDKQKEKEDYEFDDMYAFILKNWKVKEIIYLDNLKIIEY